MERIKLTISSIREKSINCGTLRVLHMKFGSSKNNKTEAMFLNGHKVATKKGFVCVEKLKKGDEILAMIETLP